MYATLARNPLQRRLLDLEEVQQRRRQEAMVAEFGRLMDEADGRMQAAITLVWFWLSHEPGGPTEEGLSAMLRLLRGQTLSRRYRVLVLRAEAELAQAEAGEPGPLFVDVARWLDLDGFGGKGPHGAALTW